MAKEQTPILRQYLDIKKDYADSILLFRMGDFYETFFNDAVSVSDILQIVLTSREYGDQKVPLAGFPVKAADFYISKLVKTGRKIAVCEQLEEPGKNIKLVRRGVTEVITKGTIMRESLLAEKENNYIASLSVEGGASLAAADISTGEFEVVTFSDRNAMIEYAKGIYVREVIENEDSSVFDDGSSRRISGHYYDDAFCEEAVKRHFGVYKTEGLGFDDGVKSQIKAAGSLIQYLEDNQRTGLEQIKDIRFTRNLDYMFIDSQTLRNLEIFRRGDGGDENTFIDVIDRTITPMGGRRLRKEMLRPLTDMTEIERRHDHVQNLINDAPVLAGIRSSMKGIGDLERINARVITGRAQPRDLINLSDGMARMPALKDLLNDASMRETANSIYVMTDMTAYLESALDRNAVLGGAKERYIKKGYNDEYDRLADISGEIARRIIELEKAERERSGISNLKIGYNNVSGYYIEVTNSNRSKVPSEYIRKQTLKNAERYVNNTLREYEQEIFSSDERLIKLENELYQRILKEVSLYYDKIGDNCESVSYCDMISSFAESALENSYKRPVMSDSDRLVIENGRHPVVERMSGTGRFVPNNIVMDSNNRIILLTGPNMAGKSTYLRQNALIIYMAHLGMFVPAENAEIPKTDRIFTRIGASDDISRGVSTFMAEMLETANIVNNMTQRSFIVLDEIGRGTSTFDGLSIAWAILEYLHESDMRPKTLFATHYHELTELAVKLERLKNYTVKVKKTDKKMLFLRKVVEGSSDESYGIEVAGMAGMPREITENAYSILHLLKENEESIKEKMRDVEQLKLFGKAEEERGKKSAGSLKKAVDEADIENMTPINALILLQELKKISEGS